MQNILQNVSQGDTTDAKILAVVVVTVPCSIESGTKRQTVLPDGGNQLISVERWKLFNIYIPIQKMAHPVVE